MPETYNGRTFYSLSNLRTACAKADYELTTEKEKGTLTIKAPGLNAIYTNDQAGIDDAMGDVLEKFGTKIYEDEEG